MPRAHIFALLAGLACSSEPVGLPAPSAPEVVEASVAALPTSVLGAVVTASTTNADSVAVRFGQAGAELDEVSPSRTTTGAPVEIPVLGLRPETNYALVAIAYGAAGEAAGDTLHLTTGALPDDLPVYVAGGPAASEGFVAFSTGLYGVVIDNTGRIVWYVPFPGGPSLNFQAQPNGRYIARPGTPNPTDEEPLLEFDVLGQVTRTLGCAAGLRPRFHDVLVTPDGDYWLMCDETRTMDLSPMGGSASAAVTGTVVQHIGAGGELLFSWSTFDHFAITDAEPSVWSGAVVNWTHGNALDLDGEGGLYLSFRSLNEVTKVDVNTGEVVWRFGGLANQFELPGPGAPFLRQHGLRVAPSGALVLLDNFGEEPGSRAERWVVDAGAGTAQLTGIYSPNPVTRAGLGGTTQRLASGGTLVAYGDGGRLEEYDGDGARVWEIEGNAGYVFRAQRIRSLYDPSIGLNR
jgi:hypothetical protein